VEGIYKKRFAVKSKVSNDPEVAKTAVMARYRQLSIALLENGLQQEPRLASRGRIGFG
jgi:hypothetical protein